MVGKFILAPGCALLETGEADCWGSGLAFLGKVPFGFGRRAVRLSVGRGHACAILETGQLKCWGDGSFGRLGLGDEETRGDDPNELGEKLPEVDLGGG